MLHIPLLRQGQPYQSLDIVRVFHHRTGEPFVEISQANSGLKGLTRNLDLEILDTGFGLVVGKEMSFFPRSDSLGVVLPSNSPGVHSLWIPAVALKTPLVLKPGSAEP